MSTDAIAYFRKAALEYVRGDLRQLLGANLTCAGPLLAVTVNGIDIMGGICFSFSPGSGERSKKYMENHMHIDKKTASAI
ncbi:MAG TPA: hypothetical protein VF590_16720 [Isosphaeraceae bacterium]|jgi:hypothetical protein